MLAADQFLNLKLDDIEVLDSKKYPHMVITRFKLTNQMSVKNCFIRGSVVRYAHLPEDQVDITLLQNSARLEADQIKQQNQ